MITAHAKRRKRTTRDRDNPPRYGIDFETVFSRLNYLADHAEIFPDATFFLSRGIPTMYQLVNGEDMQRAKTAFLFGLADFSRVTDFSREYLARPTVHVTEDVRKKSIARLDELIACPEGFLQAPYSITQKIASKAGELKGYIKKNHERTVTEGLEEDPVIERVIALFQERISDASSNPSNTDRRLIATSFANSLLTGRRGIVISDRTAVKDALVYLFRILREDHSAIYLDDLKTSNKQQGLHPARVRVVGFSETSRGLHFGLKAELNYSP